MEHTEKQIKLLNAAKRMFADNGFHGTPTSRIAKEAKVSNGILFHYYPTKEDLIRAIYFDIKDRLAVELENIQLNGATTSEHFYQIWYTILVYQLNHIEDFKFVRQYESSIFYDLEKDLAHPLLQSFITSIDAGKKEGVINQELPSLLIYKMSSSLLEGLVGYLSSNKDELNKKDKYAKLQFGAMWNSIKK